MPRSESPKPGTLPREVITSIGSYSFSLIVAFFLSPYLIRSLGDARYGIWSIVSDLAGYYGLLDLGITGAVGHYVARYAATHRCIELKHSVSTAFGSLALAGALALPGGIAVAVYFQALFPTTQGVGTEAGPAICIIALTVALSLPMAVFPAILVGQRRQYVLNTIDVSSRLLNALLIVFALRLGAGLAGVAAAQLATKIFSWACTVSIIRRSNPSLMPRWRGWRGGSLKELVGYGSQSAAINLGWILVNQTDNLMVGAFVGIQWVTYYSIGAMLVQYGSAACSCVTRSFTPHFTHLHASGEFEQLNRVFLHGVRLAGAFSAILVSAMFVWGGPLISLWIGPAYVSGPWTLRSDAVMIVLLLAHFPRLLQSISWQLLFASRTQSYLLRLTLIEAIANLTLTLLLVRRYQLLGVAVGTLAPLAVTHLFFLPRFVVRRFGLGWRRYFTQGVARPLGCGGLSLIVMWALRSYLYPLSWPLLFTGVAASMAAAAVIVWFVGMDGKDRLAASSVLIRLLPQKAPTVAGKGAAASR